MKQKRWLLCWVLLCFSSLLVLAQDTAFTYPDTMSSLQTIKLNALKIKKELQNLRTTIATLETDNATLSESLNAQLSISQGQATELTALKNTLTQYSMQLETSTQRINSLSRWNRIWKTIAAVLAGIAIVAVAK